MKKKIALITCQDLSHLHPEDYKLSIKLAELNIQVSAIVWDKIAVSELVEFDCLIIRTPWDYTKKIQTFYEWLDQIEKLKIKTLNSIELIKWNIQKTYLRQLSSKLVPVIPTECVPYLSADKIRNIMVKKFWKRVVIKPVISAGGENTIIWDGLNVSALQLIDPQFESRPMLIQPFISQVSKNGEWSFIFFNNSFSHSILKKTAQDDFRVQEQFGGSWQLTDAPMTLVEQAKSILKKIPYPHLYCRIDGINKDGKLILMEVEAIEPQLFLANDDLVSKFADSILKHL